MSLTEDNSPPPSGSDSDSDSDEMEFIAKSMGDLMNRKSLDKLLENEYIKLRDMGGPRVQEMISFAKEVNRKYPLVSVQTNPVLLLRFLYFYFSYRKPNLSKNSRPGCKLTSWEYLDFFLQLKMS